jgi:hypothetical protein
MSTVLSNRRLVVTILAFTLAALTFSLALGRPWSAQAQVPTATVVLSNFEVFVSNGHTSLPEFSGTDDGVVGAACTGSFPRTGPNIPAQVVTALRADLTHMRILHSTGSPLNGTVQVNCVLEVEVGEPAASSLRALTTR